MGATALRDGLKQVVVKNTSGCVYPDCRASLEAGMLTLDHLPTTNVHDAPARAKRIVAVLEQAL